MAPPLIEPTLTHQHIAGTTKLLGMFSFAARHMFLESLDSGEHNSPHTLWDALGYGRRTFWKHL